MRGTRVSIKEYADFADLLSWFYGVVNKNNLGSGFLVISMQLCNVWNAYITHFDCFEEREIV